MSTESEKKTGWFLDALFSAQTLFALCALFIVYATTIPFQFDRAPTLADANLVPFWDEKRGRIHSIPDLIQNVIFFVPLGFFAVVGLKKLRGKSMVQTVVMASAIGLGLSLFVEILQTMSMLRRTSASDLATNTIGAAIGAAVAWVYIDGFEVRFKRILRETTRDQPGLIIFGAMIVQLTFRMWAPFIPSLDIGTMRGQAKVLYYNPWGDKPAGALLIEALLFGGLALVTARELPGFLKRRGWLKLDRVRPELAAAIGLGVAAALAVVLELGQVPLIHHTPGLKELFANVFGALVGAGLAYGLLRDELEPATELGALTRSVPWLVLAFGVLVPVVRALSPFQFLSFGDGLDQIVWAEQLPFWSFFRRINPATFINVFEAASMYACLGFALRVLGRPMLAAFGIALLLAEVLEILQIPVVDRTFDVTEGFLAATGALVGAWAYEKLIASLPKRKVAR